jgi:hypothetical protein
MLDTSIPMSGRFPEPESPINGLAQLIQLRGAMQQNRLGAMQVRDAERQNKLQQTVRGLLAVNTEEGPEGSLLNERRFTQDLTKLGYGDKALEYQSQFQKNRLDLSKMDAETRKALIDRTESEVKLAGTLAAGATDQSSWDRALQVATAAKLDTSKMPRRFDPTVAKQISDWAKSAADKIAEQRLTLDKGKETFEQGPKFQEQKRHHDMQHKVGMAQAEATAAAKQTTLGRLPDTAVAKLSDIGGKVDTFSRLITSASPQFFGSSWANKLGDKFTVDAMRAMGVGTEITNWWQDYDSFKNEMRHGIFGASLTPGEKSEFERTVITPRMSPELAQRNLQRQYELARKSAEKMVSAYEAGGYNRQQITAAIGGSQGASGAPAAPGALPAAGGSAGAPAAPQGQIRKTQSGILMYTPRRAGG